MKAAIAGGGIGGLAAAICLAGKGWQVEVYEQAGEIREVGAGLQISPNGSRLLERMGVWQRLAGQVFRPGGVEMVYGRSGRRIFLIPMAGDAVRRWGAPYVQVHRADLIEALRLTLEDRAPGAIRTGRRALGYAARGAGATLMLEDGRVEADLVVGADGIHSVIRAAMLGPDRPVFTGNVAWRAVVPLDRLDGDDPPPVARIWVGSRRHAITTRVRAGTMANFVGITEQEGWHEEGWSHPGDRALALGAFGDWSPILARIIERCEQPFRWALFGRAPLPRWTDGAVALLGDAAHPMLPSMAQGAVQAIEDAFVLAECVSSASDVADGAARYFAARRARAAKVQAGSARNLRLYHSAGGPAGLVAFPVLSLIDIIAPGLLARQLDWLYGWEP